MGRKKKRILLANLAKRTQQPEKQIIQKTTIEISVPQLKEIVFEEVIDEIPLSQSEEMIVEDHIIAIISEPVVEKPVVKTVAKTTKTTKPK